MTLYMHMYFKAHAHDGLACYCNINPVASYINHIVFAFMQAAITVCNYVAMCSNPPFINLFTSSYTI